jgi:prolyl oligopeptidase
MKKALVIFYFLIYHTFTYGQKIAFPQLKKGNYSFKLNNKLIADEYSALDTNSTQTLKWLYEQQKYYKEYKSKLNNFSTFDNIKDFSTYSNSSYQILGKYFFKIFYNKNGIGIYKSTHINQSELLIDNPNIVDKNEDVALIRSLSLSNDNSKLAYTYSVKGTEHLKLKIFDINKLTHLSEKLNNISWNEIQWYNDGFFYNNLDSSEIKYHKLNTNPINDSTFVTKNQNPDIQNQFFVLNNQHYFILKMINHKTHLTNVYCYDFNLSKPFFSPLIIKNENNITLIDAYDSLIFFTASTGEYNNNLYAINPKKSNQWKLILQNEPNELLTEVKIIENYIIASFKKGPQEILKVHDIKGNLLALTETPIGFSIANIQYVKQSKSFYFDLISFILPAITYEYNLKKKSFNIVEGIYISFDSKKYEMISETVNTDYGVNIPILIAKSKSTNLKNAPLLMESYGGYGINFENHFRADIIDFINKGGVYVRAYIRGGGELGEAWHKDGAGIKKSNTFMDFVACAKYLIKNEYTNPNKFAIRGGSHGGLVIGVAITQYPELFKAAICTVAPLDIVGLLKTEKSAFQNAEYGNPNNPAELDSLIKYNPYYNIKNNINYPSTFIYTAQNDERVPWNNSAKFAAKLQNNPQQINPVVFYVEENAGHFGAEKSFEDYIKEKAFQNRFIYQELDMN